VTPEEFLRQQAEEAKPKPPNGDGSNHQDGDDTKDSRPRIEVHNAGAIDPTKIPPRGFLLGTTFCRKFISGLNSAGARRQDIDQICSVSRLSDWQKRNH